MEMVRLLLACAAIPVVASAAGFSLTVGPPVAAGTGAKVTKTKSAVLFAVRLEECDKLDKAQISGTEEGIVDGARTSLPVTMSAAESPGVYVVSPVSSPSQGVWVVSLGATCGSATAGAIVPIWTGIGGAGFLREKTKVLSHPATKAEIDAALKALRGPGN